MEIEKNENYILLESVFYASNQIKNNINLILLNLNLKENKNIIYYLFL